VWDHAKHHRNKAEEEARQLAEVKHQSRMIEAQRQSFFIVNYFDDDDSS
jgi:hypothetical protein